MFKKRGLSAIVATLIIILLTLVAVGVIWVVINNIVERGAEEIELGQYTLDLQIKAAQVQDGDITVVVVRRNPGQGNFIGMNFVFSDGQNSEIIRDDTVLKELEEKSFTFRLTEISTANLKTISVAPIFEMKSGRESIGNIADTFDVPANKSIGTGGAVLGNFAKYGPVGEGRAEYKVSSGGDKLPQFKKVIIDPLDVHLGENQTFTAEVYSPYNITEVTTSTQLDNEMLVLPLEKISTDAGGVETYSATWNVYDTHSNIYRTTFIARDSVGNENTVDLTWTDPCTGLNHGSNSILSTNCTVSTIDGLDTGNITINPGVTLTLSSGSTFVWTSGYTMHIDGKIALGGALKKGYLFYYDTDQDDAGNGTYYFNTNLNPGSTYVRAVSALSSTDCSDSNINIYQNVANVATDADQDRYYTGSLATQCVGGNSSYWYKNSAGTYNWLPSGSALGSADCNDASSVVQITRTPQYSDADGDGYTVAGSSFCGSVSTWGNSACTTAGSDYAKNSTGSCVIMMPLSGVDCYDLNASAHPGQTAYFDRNFSATDGRFDWDCNGIASKDPSMTEYQQICVKHTTTPYICSLDCPYCDPGAYATNTAACGATYNDYATKACTVQGYCPAGSVCGGTTESTWSCLPEVLTVECH